MCALFSKFLGACALSAVLRTTAATAAAFTTAFAFFSTFVLNAASGLAFHDGGTEVLHDHFDSAHRVVVAGDGDVREVRIAVGIDEGDGGDAQGAGFLDSVVLAADVNDDQRAGELGHVADAAEVSLDLAL